jgi:hypothetical protein
MSYQVNGKINSLHWYAPSVPISAVPWKGNIRRLSQIRDDQNGDISYDPSKNVNALSQLVTGKDYRLDSLTVGYTIDNGAPANTTSGTKIMPVLVGPAGETVTEFQEEYAFDQTCTPSVVFSQGAGTVEMSFDYGANWSAMPASIDANNSFRVRVQHPNSAAFTATLTLTYQ